MWFGPKNVCICAADDVCVPFFIRVKVEDILKLGSRLPSSIRRAETSNSSSNIRD